MKQHFNRHPRVLHCLRSPIGGLFRHVCDLAEQQSMCGADVAVVCDSTTANAVTNQHLHRLEQICTLGVHRTSMSRKMSVSDLRARRRIIELVKYLAVHVIHGHGAKGGAYARLVAQALKQTDSAVTAIYTPHGGSLHYDPRTWNGRMILRLERILACQTDGLIFESSYSQNIYNRNVCVPECPTSIVPNGLHAHEFAPIQTQNNAADFIFVGELRHLKGVDILLHALALLLDKHPVTAVIVGDGPDAHEFKRLAKALGLGKAVSFVGAMPAWRAFSLGRCFVLPSRAESFPYIVLEAGAAAIPAILTNVGGISEITSKNSIDLLPPDDIIELKNAMTSFLARPQRFHQAANQLQLSISRRFTVEQMAEGIANTYRMSHLYSKAPANSPIQLMPA